MHKLVAGVRVPVEMAAPITPPEPMPAQNVPAAGAPAVKKSPPAAPLTMGELLKAAIASLNPYDDAHWTQGGLPDLNVLKEKVGVKVARKDVDKVAAGVTRETVAAAHQG